MRRPRNIRRAKTPGVIVSPGSISAGGHARLAIVGFPTNSTIKVSITGQPDFTVTTANGAYSWDMFFPLNSKSGSLAIHAADTKGTQHRRWDADGPRVHGQSRAGAEGAGR